MVSSPDQDLHHQEQGNVRHEREGVYKDSNDPCLEYTELSGQEGEPRHIPAEPSRSRLAVQGGNVVG